MKNAETIHFERPFIRIIDTEGSEYRIDIDGTCGLFTRSEWKLNDDVIELFSEESQERILDAMEQTSNVPFFTTEP